MTFDEADKAIKRGDLVRFRDELECGLNPNLCNRYSWTILMVAAMHGNAEIGRLLIEKGADPNLGNNFRDTPLSLAIQTGHPSFVRLLLKTGASLDCHPHGNSFDIFLNWVEKYCGVSKAQMKNIRMLLDAERQARSGVEMFDEVEFLKDIYRRFNARDMEGVLARLHEDVMWANGMEGGHVHGREGVRSYWTRQWAMVDPHVEPVGFSKGIEGEAIVEVHQVVHGLNGNLLQDQMVGHIFTVDNELIRRFDIRGAS